MKNILIMLCLACVSYAQNRVMGEVASKSSTGITLKTDSGENVDIAITPETKILRVPPGETSLTNAATISVADVNTGDRVLARANQIIVMSRSDLEQKRSSESADWQKRGHTGKVNEVTADAFTIVTTAGETLKVATSPKTIFRRYAPESVRFSDAKPSTFPEIRAGDQVRILGEKSGDTLTAETIVSGTFRNIAGTVIAVNAASGELTLTDLETKQPVTVKVNSDSIARRLPAQMANGLAQRRNDGSGEGTASRTTPPGAPPAGNRAQPGQPAGTLGGRRDLGQMLDRLPALTLAELKPGDALIVASTAGADASRATAISILAGVEPLLTGPPSDRRLSGPWSLDINMAP